METFCTGDHDLVTGPEGVLSKNCPATYDGLHFVTEVIMRRVSPVVLFFALIHFGTFLFGDDSRGTKQPVSDLINRLWGGALGCRLRSGTKQPVSDLINRLLGAPEGEQQSYADDRQLVGDGGRQSEEDGRP
jgi:hypothetical protein